MARTGRPQRPYQPTDGSDPIVGLYKCNDGRWRINATGQKFTEADERLAIIRFRKWENDNKPSQNTFISVARSMHVSEIAEKTDKLESGSSLRIIEHDDDSIEVGYEIDEKVAYAWFRDRFFADPNKFAQEAGVPQLANFASMDLPTPDVELSKLCELYRKHADAKKQSIEEAIKSVERMQDATGAKTLRDLTPARLMPYRVAVTKSGKSAGTIQAYFGRIKWIVAFGLKHGFDKKQINDALSSLQMLYAPKNRTKHKPKPIPKADFHNLLDKSNEQWRAIMLTSLNFCMYLEEVLSLEWADIDLEKGVFVGVRGKTKIVRVAVLWKETIEALKAINRNVQYVFTSKHGTRYSTKGQWKYWDKLRTEAGTVVEFNQIRDGAYTSASEKCDLQIVKTLAGHVNSGNSDNYLQRRPHYVAPATQAVYDFYMK